MRIFGVAVSQLVTNRVLVELGGDGVRGRVDVGSSTFTARAVPGSVRELQSHGPRQSRQTTVASSCMRGA